MCKLQLSLYAHSTCVAELKKQEKKFLWSWNMDYNIGRFGINNAVFPKFVLFIKSTGTVRITHIITQSVFSTLLYLHRQMLLEIQISWFGKKSNNWPDHWFWLLVDAIFCLLRSGDLETAASQNLSRGSSSAQEHHQRVLMQHEKRFSYKNLSILDVLAVSECTHLMVIAGHIKWGSL